MSSGTCGVIDAPRETQEGRALHIREPSSEPGLGDGDELIGVERVGEEDAAPTQRGHMRRAGWKKTCGSPLGRRGSSSATCSPLDVSQILTAWSPRPAVDTNVPSLLARRPHGKMRPCVAN